MIPRVVKMAAEVASTLTVPQLEDYGNIILNGYLESVPNTINKKAWQYKETATAPVNLPSLTQITPALKGWTNNYQEYYTQLQPNDYDVDPGDPTMFEYDVHSYSSEQGSIKTIGWVNTGYGYTPGIYNNVPLTGGGGTGATANIVVTPTPGVAGGPATAVTLTNGGSGYDPNNLFSGAPVDPVTGTGSGLRLDGSTDFSGTVDSIGITPGYNGTGYETGNVVTFGNGSVRVTITSVSTAGSVTGFTIVNPGTNYIPGQAVSAVIPGGSGFSAPIVEVTPSTILGGQPRWSQAPRRLINATVSPFVPPNANSQAIQYSAILYPVSDNPLPPPVGTL